MQSMLATHSEMLLTCRLINSPPENKKSGTGTVATEEWKTEDFEQTLVRY
jgi:hypothetical protein